MLTMRSDRSFRRAVLLREPGAALRAARASHNRLPSPVPMAGFPSMISPFDARLARLPWGDFVGVQGSRRFDRALNRMHARRHDPADREALAYHSAAA